MLSVYYPDLGLHFILLNKRCANVQPNVLPVGLIMCKRQIPKKFDFIVVHKSKNY